MVVKGIKQILFFIFLLLCSCSSAVEDNNDDVSLGNLKEGDLLFVAKGTPNAITEVTQGIDGLQIDHVGIYHHTDTCNYVLEAYPPKVTLTPFTNFIARITPKDKKKNTKPSERTVRIVVGRVMTDIDIQKSMNKALSYLGRKYDNLYMPDDKELYCSELVQKSFVNHQGQLIFSTIPMTFRDKNGVIPDFWIKWYKRNNLEVPEGKPGSNPGDLSLRKQLKIGYEGRRAN